MSVNPTANTVQRAATDPHSQIWLGANAGTGKTSVLVRRVLRLLLEGSKPESILCVTYTRAAKAEMEQRIRSKLAQWATCSEEALRQDICDLTGDAAMADAARSLFVQVLGQTPVKIYTIHAFACALLERFPLEADLSPHFQVAEGDSQRLAQAAVEQTLSAPDLPELSDLGPLVAEVNLHTLMIKLAERRLHLAPPLDDKAIVRRIFDDSGIPTPTTLKEEVLHQQFCDNERAYDDHWQRVIEATQGDTTAKADNLRKTLSAWLVSNQRTVLLEDYTQLFFKKDGERRKSSLTKATQKHDPGVEPLMDEATDRLIQHRAIVHTANLARVSVALHGIGRKVGQHYHDHKRAQGLLDYDDLILEACNLLKRDDMIPWVQHKLDQAIDHILLDEAQDTAPAQWEVLLPLMRHILEDNARRSVFVVGDVKQSIFGFQGARPELLGQHHETLQAHSGRDITSLSMAVSFRSAPEILRFVDTVFEDQNAGLLDVSSHTPARATPGCVEFWPLVVAPEKDDDLPWDAITERQQHPGAEDTLAETIAQWIATRQGRLWLPDAQGWMRPEDVLILLERRGGMMPALLKALGRHGLATPGADRLRLREQLVVRDVLALTQVALNPSLDYELAAVLKSPLVGIGEERLFELCHGREEQRVWQRLQATPELAEVYGWLQALEEFAAGARPVDWLHRVLDWPCPSQEVDGVISGRRALVRRLGDQALEPLEALMHAAETLEESGGLYAFVQAVQSTEDDVKRDAEINVAGACRIMTIHSAKGLEAPVVILALPHSVKHRRNEADNLDWIEPEIPVWLKTDFDKAPLVQHRKQAREEEERRGRYRLLYVALTRARERLVLAGSGIKKSEDWDIKNDWTWVTAAALAKLTDQPSETIFTEGAHLGELSPTVTEVPSAKPAAPSAPSAPSEPAPPPPEWLWRSPPPEPTPPRALTPSRTESVPVCSPLVQVLQDDTTRKGRFLHHWLQRLPELEPAARERLLASIRQPEAAWLREAMAVLQEPAFSTLFGPHSLAEVPITGQHNDVVISGQIDRLVLLEDEVWVVDYKTSSDSKPELYKAQMKSYTALVSALYPGRTVRCFLLWTHTLLLEELHG